MTNKITDKDHAKLGPSSYDRWSTCEGSVWMSDGQPNNVSRYAAEGTVAHEIADMVLSEQIADASEGVGQSFESDGFTFVVDEEMAGYVEEYVEEVRSRVTDGAILFPEQQVRIGHLTGVTGAEGVADAIIGNDKRTTVIDLKYGKGVRVNAEDNGQGRLYALGALHKFRQIFDTIEEVEIVIVQPRIENGITSEVLSIGELEEH